MSGIEVVDVCNHNIVDTLLVSLILKSVWPAVGPFNVGCAIKSELGCGYQLLKWKAGGLRRRGSAVDTANGKDGMRKCERGNSVGKRYDLKWGSYGVDMCRVWKRWYRMRRSRRLVGQKI